MKIDKTIIGLFLLVIAQFSAVAQTKQLAEADRLFNTKAYALAIDAYTKAIEKGESSIDIYKKLGDAYYLNANYKDAANCYAKLMSPDIKNSDSEYLFKYAQTLRSNGNYDEADKIMLQFNKIKQQDLRASKFIEKLDYLENLKNIKQKYTLTNLESNSVESDFAPSFYKDSLVFSSARDTGFLVNNLHEWNNRPFLNLHTAKKDSLNYVYLGNFAKELNTKTHESSSTFTKDGKTVYFTRNNSENGKFSPDKNGLSRLKIYKATLENGKWTNVTELPFNNDEYSVANPTLNYTEDKLYFASDMPGTLGASDIFVVAINSDGSFGEPQNLGATINTEGRETFPFISESETLYFASDGHPGLGGLDMFYINLQQENAEVRNMGKGVNSRQDDFSLIINESKNEGFLASNRPKGKGSDDIYRFIRESVTKVIKGKVIDKETNTIVVNAMVTIYDYENNNLVETVSDENGFFTTEVNLPEKKYRFTAKSDGYADAVKYIYSPKNNTKIEKVVLELENSKEATAVGSDLSNYLKLKSIYFDTNSSYLRVESYPDLDKVANYMLENPTVVIEVGSHTDSTESDTYNLWLSNRRAKSTVKYLVSKGVDQSRITGIGFGESQLLNKCKNGVKCSNEEHAVNRRSEFIIITK
ncbi:MULTISPECIES: OmpA family protein [unclassified Cellulophaga]|uniref:OmpA family protein n=2 Tax=Pseudomonadati TaxID=3379134 RepID=UPI0026E42E0E|nr:MULTISPECIES: OmpA family protein [unclassified Cellulophaga]MDO6492213.1 OmpA family protein [Cellulophaga sp. 2_MG-2023]MDO6493163.1 OmpA family protein [Cellulophaga sp. 3_MG-2023]